MNYRLIFKLIGTILLLLSLLMILPFVVSFLRDDGEHLSFLFAIIITAVVGAPLFFLKQKNEVFSVRDAFVVTGLSWFILTVFGALPFYFSGSFSSIVDCIFESASGFSTTGSTILTDIEAVPDSIIFWRCFSHWIGGIGVLVFIMALIPSTNASSINILRAESTGPSPDKIVPRIRETAKIICFIYLGLSALLAVLLYIAGLPVYESVINAFSTAGTGGFSNLNNSIAGYGNLAAEVIITIFMLLFGVSFTIYFLLLAAKIKKALFDEELRLYGIIVVVAILIITVDISSLYGGFGNALRYSSFQVSSIISSTGYATADITLWPTLSQAVLFALMFTGCCAGSTGGGIKLIRFLLMAKMTKNELIKVIHPNSIKNVSLNDKKVSTDIMAKTSLFFFIYVLFLLVGTIIVSLDGLGLVESCSSVISSLSNIGPAFGSVGHAANYAAFSDFSKITLSVCMIAGRLEFIPVLILFVPSVWKKRYI